MRWQICLAKMLHDEKSFPGSGLFAKLVVGVAVTETN